LSDDSRTDSEIILYQTEDGQSRLEVHFSGETAWLTQNQMAKLFQTTNFAGMTGDGAKILMAVMPFLEKVSL
jgi:hypothetical protein